MKKLFTLFCMACSICASAQTAKYVNNMSPTVVGQLTANKAIVVTEQDRKLWVTDGTVAGTQMIATPVLFHFTAFEVMNGVLYFSGGTNTHGIELWRTDGTAAGTYMVKDINPGAVNSGPGDRMIVLNNHIYFSAFSDTHGRELWKSDGTTAGTVLVKDVFPGIASAHTIGLFKINKTNNRIYFVANTNVGEELWVSDGTEAGTQLVRDINVGAGSATPMLGMAKDNKMYFSADNGINGRELWVTDGTQAGTIMLGDIYPGGTGSTPQSMTVFNNKIFFVANAPQTGEELFQTDGTVAGTSLVKDLEPGILGSDINLTSAVIVNNKLYFRAHTNLTGYELFVTDGTANGTELFFEIDYWTDGFPVIFKPHNAPLDGSPTPLFQNQYFFFTGFTLDHGTELYISDGTRTGTRMVKDVNAGFSDGVPYALYKYSNTHLYFTAENATTGLEIWETDGTAQNTRMVFDANPNNTNEGGLYLITPDAIVNNNLLFAGPSGDEAANRLQYDGFIYQRNNGTLPIFVQSFTARLQAQTPVLQWQLNITSNNNRYQLQRSADGVNYTTIESYQPTQGAVTKTYADVAASALQQKQLYYRLAIENNNGSKQYSNIATVTMPNEVYGVRVLQQAGKPQVKYHLSKNNTSLQVVTATGAVVYNTVLPATQGVLTLPQLQAGLYVIKVSDSNQTYTDKLLMP